jgi:hypothetical protein
MYYLVPWFYAMKQSPSAFRAIMTEAGVSFSIDDEEWAIKNSVVTTINQLCGTELTQKQIWQSVYDSRKNLDSKFDFLFPNDPEFKRKRTFCHSFEAWYAIASLCVKHDCLHLWLCRFNLTSAFDVIQAKRIIFDGEIIVNGLCINGSGFIEL